MMRLRRLPCIITHNKNIYPRALKTNLPAHTETVAKEDVRDGSRNSKEAYEGS